MSPGVPNTIDANRFSPPEVERFSQWWQELRSPTEKQVARVAALVDEPVSVPDPDEQSVLEKKADELEGAKVALPWWARVVVEHREHFARVAVGVAAADGMYPDTVFVVVLAVQQPKGLHMVRGHIRLPELPALEASPADLDPMLLWAKYEFDCEYCDAVDIRVGDDDVNLVVLPSLIYVPGGVSTNAAPIPFELFCAHLDGRTVKPVNSNNPRKPKVCPPAVADRLRELYPWLTDDDIQRARDRAPVSRSNDTSEPHSARASQRLGEEDVEEAIFEQVRTALEEKRLEWDFQDENVTVNFYVHLAGGAWTKRFKGVESDSAVAKPRAHVKDFCNRFQWPKHKVFHFSAHGERGANMLAREWCRKGHHYFEVWIGSGGLETFQNPADHEYIPDLEFLDWVVEVDTESPTWAKITELSNQVPVRRTS